MAQDALSASGVDRLLAAFLPFWWGACAGKPHRSRGQADAFTLEARAQLGIAREKQATRAMNELIRSKQEIDLRVSEGINSES